MTSAGAASTVIEAVVWSAMVPPGAGTGTSRARLQTCRAARLQTAGRPALRPVGRRASRAPEASDVHALRPTDPHPRDQRIVNVSAEHQPRRRRLPDGGQDGLVPRSNRRPTTSYVNSGSAGGMWQHGTSTAPTATTLAAYSSSLISCGVRYGVRKPPPTNPNVLPPTRSSRRRARGCRRAGSRGRAGEARHCRT